MAAMVAPLAAVRADVAAGLTAVPRTALALLLVAALAIAPRAVSRTR
jgi:hypothetical protein